MTRAYAVVVVLVAAAAGCAIRHRPVPPARDVLAESAAALRAGCFRCLEEGFALVGDRADVPGRQRAFELAVLLAVRAKELGLPFEPWRDRATAIAAALPVSPATAAIATLIDGLPFDSAARDRNQAFGRLRPPPATDLRASLAAIEASGISSETKLYLQLAGACAFFLSDLQEPLLARVRAPEPPLVSHAAGPTPLLEYAAGRCRGDAPALLRVIDREPRFADAALPLARISLRPGAVAPNADALQFFARAREAFPESPAIAYSMGALLRERGDSARALAEFDATLRLVPAHHDARLGRVMALSNLARHDEAIAAATSLIDEGTWLVGDAYYWRGWNELSVGRLDEAERDVVEAKQRLVSSSVFVLSGLVQWRKGRPVVAEEELMRAVGMSADDCAAASYLGSVRGALRKWMEAAAAFAGTAACREREGQLLRKTLDDLTARGAAEPVLAAQRTSIIAVERQTIEAIRRGDAMLSATLDEYRLRPTAFCELTSESPPP